MKDDDLARYLPLARALRAELGNFVVAMTGNVEPELRLARFLKRHHDGMLRKETQPYIRICNEDRDDEWLTVRGE